MTTRRRGHRAAVTSNPRGREGAVPQRRPLADPQRASLAARWIDQAPEAGAC